MSYDKYILLFICQLLSEKEFFFSFKICNIIVLFSTICYMLPKYKTSTSFFSPAILDNLPEFSSELREMPVKLLACIGLAMHQVQTTPQSHSLYLSSFEQIIYK